MILNLSNLNDIERISLEEFSILGNEVHNGNEEIIDLKIRVKIIRSGDKTENKSVIFGEYIKNWLYNVKFNELKPASFDRKEQTIEYQIIPFLGNLALNEINSSNIQQMINELTMKYSYSTIKKAYETVNACLKYALLNHDIQYNAAEAVTLPKNIKPDTSNIDFFTEEEMKKIIKEAFRCYKNGKRIYRLGEIVLFLVNTGLRIGECLALKWSDIDWEKHTVRVRKNVVYVKKRKTGNPIKKEGYQVVEQNKPKTKSGDRIVPLNDAAQRALISIKGINGKNELIFSTSKGRRIYPRNIDRMFRAILTRCYISGHGVHTLRHTFASRMFRKGVDIKIISEVMGHSDVGITYNTYIHLIHEQQIKAVQLPEF